MKSNQMVTSTLCITNTLRIETNTLCKETLD